MRAMASVLLAAATQAFAQSAPTAFPADALPLTPSALQQMLAGKAYTSKLTDGSSWRWQFNSDGSFFFNAENFRGRFASAGKWSTKESTMCSEGREIPAGCNEIRQLGSDLFLQRKDGEVVRMTTQ